MTSGTARTAHRAPLATAGTRLRARRRVGVLAVSGLAALGLAACSSSGGTSPSTAPSNASTPAANSPGSGSPSGLSNAITAKLTTMQAAPVFKAPGPAFDARSAAKGKSIYVIPYASQVPVSSISADATVAAGKLVGADVHVVSSTGTSSDWVNGFNQAIAGKAAAIIIEGLPPAAIEPQLAQAESAKIPVVYSLGTALGSTGYQFPSAIKGQAGYNTEDDWRSVGDLAIQQGNGQVHALVLEIKDVVNGDQEPKLINDEFQKYCPSTCSEAKVIDEPPAQWAQKITTDVRQALQADPKINMIIPDVDGMVQYVTPALTAATASKVKIVSWNGTPSVLSDMSKGNGRVVADLGQSDAWFGYAAADVAFRLMAGKPLSGVEPIPSRIWTPQNASQSLTDGGYGGYGNPLEEYKKLWQVN